MDTYHHLQIELKSLTNKEKAKVLSSFYKTGPGEYGEGDIFLGLSVPQQREIIKKYHLPLRDIKKLLDSNIHEYRFSALLLLINKYQEGREQKTIVDFYLSNYQRINNWDLVDLSAPKILGDFLLSHPRKKILKSLFQSNNLWKKRIAIVSTLPLIKQGSFQEIIDIAIYLLDDKEDLIQKALGWMLREVGKKDIRVLESFLRQYKDRMSRVALRYSIEKFPEKKRLYYLYY